MVKKVSFNLYGQKGAWSIKSVSAWLERSVVNKVSFSMVEREMVKRASFSIVGKRRGQNVSLSTAGRGHGQKSKFQHGCMKRLTIKGQFRYWTDHVISYLFMPYHAISCHKICH
jgi:hypothetical protein